jgi:ATP-dependent Clp protease ATP-binding subunit ClpB
VIATLGHLPPPDAAAGPGGPLRAVTTMAFGPDAPIDRLDHQAAEALVRAYWHAGRAGEAEVGPEHLLLALIGSDSQWLVRLWVDIGVDPAALEATLRGPTGRSESRSERAANISRELIATITRASAIAAQRNRAFIRPEHLLLAIAGGQGRAAAALVTAGATVERIHNSFDKLGM